MTKPGRQNTETLSQRAILAWATALLEAEINDSPTAASLADWICLSELLPQLPLEATTVIWQTLLKNDLSSPPHFSALILGGFLSDLPWSNSLQISQRDFGQQLVDRHKELAQQLDPDETGLLHWPGLNHPSQHLPSVQAAWIWSTSKLLELAEVDTSDLHQLKEIYIYETDFQLWEENPGCYGTGDPLLLLTASLLTSNALALFAGIPDQERAETVLRWLQAQGSPWHHQDVSSTEWLGTSAYLLFLALKQYEMTDEAQELKEYAQKHLTDRPDDAAGECLWWLWRKK